MVPPIVERVSALLANTDRSKSAPRNGWQIDGRSVPDKHNFVNAVHVGKMSAVSHVAREQGGQGWQTCGT